MPYRTVTHTGTRTASRDLGYDLIPLCRPNLIFFKIVNLRPEVPHWFFFDGKDVTKWINTSYAYSDYQDAVRTSNLKDPGDQYINADQFPHQLGGPTAASGPINSSANGEIEGLFYLQSNTTTNFNAGKRILTAIDISVLKQSDCLSFAQGEYQAIGEYQLYNEYQETYTYTTQEYYAAPSNNDDVIVTHKPNKAGNGTDIKFDYGSYSVTHHWTKKADGSGYEMKQGSGVSSAFANTPAGKTDGATWTKNVNGNYWTRSWN
jgi:hypothetical protein